MASQPQYAGQQQPGQYSGQQQMMMPGPGQYMPQQMGYMPQQMMMPPGYQQMMGNLGQNPQMMQRPVNMMPGFQQASPSYANPQQQGHAANGNPQPGQMGPGPMQYMGGNMTGGMMTMQRQALQTVTGSVPPHTAPASTPSQGSMGPGPQTGVRPQMSNNVQEPPAPVPQARVAPSQAAAPAPGVQPAISKPAPAPQQMQTTPSAPFNMGSLQQALPQPNGSMMQGPMGMQGPMYYTHPNGMVQMMPNSSYGMHGGMGPQMTGGGMHPMMYPMPGMQTMMYPGMTPGNFPGGMMVPPHYGMPAQQGFSQDEAFPHANGAGSPRSMSSFDFDVLASKQLVGDPNKPSNAQAAQAAPAEAASAPAPKHARSKSASGAKLLPPPAQTPHRSEVSQSAATTPSTKKRLAKPSFGYADTGELQNYEKSDDEADPGEEVKAEVSTHLAYTRDPFNLTKDGEQGSEDDEENEQEDEEGGEEISRASRGGSVSRTSTKAGSARHPGSTAKKGEADKGLIKSGSKKLAPSKSLRVVGDKLRVQFQMRAAQNREVCYKHDGKRFVNAETTLKLSANMMYEIAVFFNPGATVRDGSAIMRLYLDRSLPPVKVPFSEIPAATGRSGYRCRWPCKLPVSPKKSRVYLWFDFMVEDFGKLSVPLLLKVYQPEDERVFHGLPLRAVNLDFKRDPIDKARINLLGCTYA